MVSTREFGIDAVQKAFERAYRDAEAERARRQVESLNRRGTSEERAAQLIQFVVDRRDHVPLLAVFNHVTGQSGLAMASCVEDCAGKRTRALRWSILRRVKSTELLGALHSGHCRLPQPPHPEPLYPEWLFDPTDERDIDWLPALHSIRHRMLICKMQQANETVGNGMRELCRVMLAVAALTAVIGIAYFAMTGVAGLFAFGGRLL